MSDGIQPRIKLLAVASQGGHWEQLMLLRPALDPFEVIFATTDRDLAIRDGLADVELLPETNRHHPLSALLCFWRALLIMRRIKPDFVVTTGALPGLICMIVGRMLGARTIWIDSVANSENISKSGSWARHFATLSLTQWEHLSQPPTLVFAGRLL